MDVAENRTVYVLSALGARAHSAGCHFFFFFQTTGENTSQIFGVRGMNN